MFDLNILYENVCNVGRNKTILKDGGHVMMWHWMDNVHKCVVYFFYI